MNITIPDGGGGSTLIWIGTWLWSLEAVPKYIQIFNKKWDPFFFLY